MISYNQSYICRRRPFEYDSTRFRHSSLKKFSASEIAPSTGEIADALIEMEQRIKRQQTALRPGMVWRHWGVKTQGRLVAMVGFIKRSLISKSDSLRGRGSFKDRWNQMRGVRPPRLNRMRRRSTRSMSFSQSLPNIAMWLWSGDRCRDTYPAPDVFWWAVSPAMCPLSGTIFSLHSLCQSSCIFFLRLNPIQSICPKTWQVVIEAFHEPKLLPFFAAYGTRFLKPSFESQGCVQSLSFFFLHPESNFGKWCTEGLLDLWIWVWMLQYDFSLISNPYKIQYFNSLSLYMYVWFVDLDLSCLVDAIVGSIPMPHWEEPLVFFSRCRRDFSCSLLGGGVAWCLDVVGCLWTWFYGDTLWHYGFVYSGVSCSMF